MNRFPRIGAALGLLALLTQAPAAMAHGDGAHGAAPRAAPVEREQQDWGVAAAPGVRARTVQIRMLDGMRFVPDRLSVRQGETLRLVFRNEGQLLHEAVLGTPASLNAHAEMMLKHPDMEHEEAHMVHVAAGKSGEIVWTFNRAGEFDFACLIPGHFQAGMVGRIRVLPAAAGATVPQSTQGETHESHAH